MALPGITLYRSAATNEDVQLTGPSGTMKATISKGMAPNSICHAVSRRRDIFSLFNSRFAMMTEKARGLEKSEEDNPRYRFRRRRRTLFKGKQGEQHECPQHAPQRGEGKGTAIPQGDLHDHPVVSPDKRKEDERGHRAMNRIKSNGAFHRASCSHS